jgi:hypothetical protein
MKPYKKILLNLRCEGIKADGESHLRSNLNQNII